MPDLYPPNPPSPISRMNPKMPMRMESQRDFFLIGLIGCVSSSLDGLIRLCVFSLFRHGDYYTSL